MTLQVLPEIKKNIYLTDAFLFKSLCTSRNPAIVSLPHELGRLQKLLVLELEDISVEDKELQLLIASLSK